MSEFRGKAYVRIEPHTDSAGKPYGVQIETMRDFADQVRTHMGLDAEEYLLKYIKSQNENEWITDEYEQLYEGATLQMQNIREVAEELTEMCWDMNSKGYRMTQNRKDYLRKKIYNIIDLVEEII